MHARTLLLSLALTASFTPVLAPAVAAAQQAPENSCTTMIHLVRVSEIKPGMMDTFVKAAAAQQAWYKSKGTPDQIVIMKVMKEDPATKAWKYSETEALADHIQPPNREHGPAHDSGYDEFVAMFAKSSTIKSMYVTCGTKM